MQTKIYCHIKHETFPFQILKTGVKTSQSAANSLVKEKYVFLMFASRHLFYHIFSASFRLRGKTDVFCQLTYPFEVRERHMVAELTVCHANDKLGTVHDENFVMSPCMECISGQLHLFTNR